MDNCKKCYTRTYVFVLSHIIFCIWFVMFLNGIKNPELGVIQLLRGLRFTQFWPPSPCIDNCWHDTPFFTWPSVDFHLIPSTFSVWSSLFLAKISNWITLNQIEKNCIKSYENDSNSPKFVINIRWVIVLISQKKFLNYETHDQIPDLEIWNQVRAICFYNWYSLLPKIKPWFLSRLV